jgi:hypothetical protein
MRWMNASRRPFSPSRYTHTNARAVAGIGWLSSLQPPGFSSCTTLGIHIGRSQDLRSPPVIPTGRLPALRDKRCGIVNRFSFCAPGTPIRTSSFDIGRRCVSSDTKGPSNVLSRRHLAVTVDFKNPIRHRGSLAQQPVTPRQHFLHLQDQMSGITSRTCPLTICVSVREGCFDNREVSFLSCFLLGIDGYGMKPSWAKGII